MIDAIVGALFPPEGPTVNPQYQSPQQPVIDRSAALRIATALGWEPKRKPLTDEEIAKLYFDNFSMGELKAFARAIEAAHGIGGEA